MEKWCGKVALVTGASSGIGAAIAVRLANEGMIVVGAAPIIEPIEELAKRVNGSGKILAKRCDLTVDSDIEELFIWIENTVGHIAVLVNNAALFCLGTIHDIDGFKSLSTEEISNLMNLNVNGYIKCSRFAFKSMTKGEIAGHIINIDSKAGHVVPSLGGKQVFNVYPISKHAIRAFSEITRQEVSMTQTGVRVTDIAPGAVKTEMWNSSTSAMSEVVPQLSKVPMLEPEDVADAVCFALMASPRSNISEIVVQGIIPKLKST